MPERYSYPTIDNSLDMAVWSNLNAPELERGKHTLAAYGAVTLNFFADKPLTSTDIVKVTLAERLAHTPLSHLQALVSNNLRSPVAQANLYAKGNNLKIDATKRPYLYMATSREDPRPINLTNRPTDEELHAFALQLRQPGYLERVEAGTSVPQAILELIENELQPEEIDVTDTPELQTLQAHIYSWELDLIRKVDEIIKQLLRAGATVQDPIPVNPVAAQKLAEQNLIPRLEAEQARLSFNSMVRALTLKTNIGRRVLKGSYGEYRNLGLKTIDKRVARIAQADVSS